jgi:dienelactone hydrolase
LEITLTTKRVQEIPVLTLAPAETQPKMQLPVIFFIPGYRNTKETGLSLGYRLARQGFFFLSFDPWLHGERYDRRLDAAHEPALGGIYPPDTGLDIGWVFYQVIQRCLEDVHTLLDELAKDVRLDLQRCGVTGPSMGGCASYLVFAQLSQVRAAVAMIGIPTFARRWQDILDESRYSNAAWAAALAQVSAQTQAQTEFITRMDPYPRLKSAAPKALLMMNNDFDTDQPKHYAIDAYRELLPFYRAHPDKLRLNIYPARHEVTPEMEQVAVGWFSQHLQPVPSMS